MAIQLALLKQTWILLELKETSNACKKNMCHMEDSGKWHSEVIFNSLKGPFRDLAS